MKKAIVILLLFVFFIYGCANKLNVEVTFEQKCELGGGKITGGNACGDRCGSEDSICAELLYDICNCGAGQCWDEKNGKCILGGSNLGD